MTTITIKSSENLSRTKFENLEELRAFLSTEDRDSEFSDEFQAQIKKRSEDVKSGKVETHSLEEIQAEITSRIS